MVAALGSYGSVLWLEHAAHLWVDTVVLSVVLAMTLSRTVQRADWVDRAVGLVLVPAVAVGASEIGRLMADRVVVGSTLFATAVAATIFVRRWGPRCTVAGALATAPLLAQLIVPALPIGRTNVWWSALVGLIAYAWTITYPPSNQVKSALNDHSRARGSPGFNTTAGDRRSSGGERQAGTDSPAELAWKDRSRAGSTVSVSPQRTDSLRAVNGKRERIHPTNMRESPIRSPGVPPVSTLPVGTTFLGDCRSGGE
jgi:hypothetical protein